MACGIMDGVGGGKNMVISGLQKLTLLDFPQKVACTVFLGGCNLRCPFCQNGEILDGRTAGMTEDDFFAFLKKRQKILDGVCVSGGEPLLHEGIFSFIEKIRALGYAVKLDTNGTFTVRLKRLVQERLIDYVAMDIKNSPKKYARTAGAAVDLENIRESAAFLMESGIDYEFRTTVVAKYHRSEDFIAIGEWLRGAKKYFLQNFVDSEFVLEKGLTAYSDEDLQAFKQLLLPYIPTTKIRGE